MAHLIQGWEFTQGFVSFPFIDGSASVKLTASRRLPRGIVWRAPVQIQRGFMVSLHKLAIFLAVVEAGSFSGAGNALYMTQSAVSQHMQDLEARFGVRLFERGRRGVVPTPAAQILSVYARALLRLAGEAERVLAEAAALAHQPLHLGATPGLEEYLLGGWIRSLRERVPALNVVVIGDRAQRLVERVLAHELHAAFIEAERIRLPGLVAISLRDVAYHLVVGRGHPWHDQDPISVQTLSAQPIAVAGEDKATASWLAKSAAAQGLPVRLEAPRTGLHTLRQRVLAGQIAALLPDYAIYQDVHAHQMRILPVQGGDFCRTLFLVWASGRPLPAPLRVFLVFLAEHFPQLLATGNQEGYAARFGQDGGPFGAAYADDLPIERH